MKSDFFQHYLKMLESLAEDDDDGYQWLDPEHKKQKPEDEDEDIEEADKTDEIDFAESDSFDQVLEKLQRRDINRIGIGKYREGWHHPFDKRLVIKIATPRDNNTIEECAARNLWEFMVWNKAYGEKMEERKVLMPSYECHPDGLWLTQFKGTRVPRDREVPIKGKTTWIGDRKKENFAMLNGDYKSIDYGSKKALEHLGLPEDYDQAREVVAKILAEQGKDTDDPNYGKSVPHKGNEPDQD